MTWSWCVRTDAEHVRGESASLLTASGWIQLMLERSRGLAEAEISRPGWQTTRLLAVDGAIHAEGDEGDEDAR